MSEFKDFLQQDLKVFMDPEVFGEPHNINGTTFNIIVDNDRLIERSKKEFDGISVGELLYYVKSEEYGPPPKADEIQSFDKKTMQVFDIRIDSGMYEIILRSCVGR